MLRRILALLCLAVASYGATPRTLADVPILMPDGKTMQLSQYRGKVLVVLIILTTCEHCQKSAELLQKIQKDYPKDFQVVAVGVNPEARLQAASFRQSYHLTFPVGYLLSEDNIMKLADFKRVDHPLSPMYMFVDKKGIVKWQYTASDDSFFRDEEKNVRTWIDALIKQ